MTANAQSIPESVPLGAPDKATESAAPVSRECRQWLNWAAAQIEDCQRMDCVAMDALVALLRPLMHAPPDAQSGSDGDGQRIPAADLVIALQSHDRIIQALTHVADSLRALDKHLADPMEAGSPAAWQRLREQRFSAFSMASERELFARLLGHHDAHAQPAAEFGCVDLFEDEP